MSPRTPSGKPEPRYEYHILLRHATQPRLLAIEQDGGWSPPHWTTGERHYWQVVAPVNARLRELLGVETTVLRCLALGYDAVTATDHRLYEAEIHDGDRPLPPGARWLERGELKSPALRFEAGRAAVAAWFDEVEAGTIPARRPPWARPGWWETAVTWIREQLSACGAGEVEPVVQLRAWERSCLARAGEFFFKAVPAVFAHEPRLTRYLAETYPAFAPEVVAVDAERGWLLMRRTDGPTLDGVTDLTRWEEAVATFACLQIALAGHADRLAALGCPDRRLEVLETQIEPLLQDRAAPAVGASGLAAAEIEQLSRLAPRLRAACRQLADAGLPPTLEHGDFWAGQVVVRAGVGGWGLGVGVPAGGTPALDAPALPAPTPNPQPPSPVFLDWSDSSLSHPFFSLDFFFATAEVERLGLGPAAVSARLRDAYLEPWRVYAPMDRLRQAFDLAQRLAPLHNAITYQRYLLPRMEAKWEMEAMLPFFLRRLLRDGVGQ